MGVVHYLTGDGEILSCGSYPTMIGAKRTRFLPLLSLCAIAFASDSSTRVLDRLSYEVNCRRIDGFDQISVLEHRGSKEKVVYKRSFKYMFLRSATPWVIPGGADEGVWMTLEYGAGSTIHQLIPAPNGGKDWRAILEGDAEGGFLFPPEIVDVKSSGVANIIYFTNLYLKAGKPDGRRSTVVVWTWSASLKKYVKAGDVRFDTRLGNRR